MSPVGEESACLSRGGSSAGDQDPLVPYEVLCGVHKAAFVVFQGAEKPRQASLLYVYSCRIKTLIQAVSGADLGAACERTSD